MRKKRHHFTPRINNHKKPTFLSSVLIIKWDGAEAWCKKASLSKKEKEGHPGVQDCEGEVCEGSLEDVESEALWEDDSFNRIEHVH